MTEVFIGSGALLVQTVVLVCTIFKMHTSTRERIARLEGKMDLLCSRWGVQDVRSAK